MVCQFQFSSMFLSVSNMSRSEHALNTLQSVILDLAKSNGDLHSGLTASCTLYSSSAEKNSQLSMDLYFFPHCFVHVQNRYKISAECFHPHANFINMSIAAK